MINHWIKIAAGGGNAQIQVRLTPTPEEDASTVGASVETESDAPPKQLPRGKGTPVILNIYDVASPQGNNGKHHAAIEIYGKEYSFGGTLNPNYDGTGIFSNPPMKCPLYQFRESKHLGDCELTRTQVEMLLEQMEPKWQAQHYSLDEKNSYSFAGALARELGMEDQVSTLLKNLQPEEVIELENGCSMHSSFNESTGWIADWFFPSAPKPEAKAPQAADSSLSLDSIEPGRGPAGRMLDHSMAARIQRAFRQRQ